MGYLKVGLLDVNMPGQTMTFPCLPKNCIALGALIALASCGEGIRTKSDTAAGGDTRNYEQSANINSPLEQSKQGMSIWEALNKANRESEIAVNKYLWNASLEVLNFLPINSVDPFSGVIVTDYGTPPGGAGAYRATIYIRDPALDARSLVIAMQTRDGRPVSADTQRAIEDAILGRARQLRIADKKL